MRIFLTGATGFIGSAIVPELLKAGHHVIGMTRSDAGAKALEEAGVEAHKGVLEEPESVRRGVEKADVLLRAVEPEAANRPAVAVVQQDRAIGLLVPDHHPHILGSLARST